MPNGLITPELVLEVVESTNDYVVTQEEFNNIVAVIISTVIGAFVFGIATMLINRITKKE